MFSEKYNSPRAPNIWHPNERHIYVLAVQPFGGGGFIRAAIQPILGGTLWDTEVKAEMTSKSNVRSVSMLGNTVLESTLHDHFEKKIEGRDSVARLRPQSPGAYRPPFKRVGDVAHCRLGGGGQSRARSFGGQTTCNRMVLGKEARETGFASGETVGSAIGRL